MALELVRDLDELDSPMKYDRTYWCTHRIDQGEEGGMTTHYCGDRWCLVCEHIKLGRRVNTHIAAIREFEDPQLVSLTIPNIPCTDPASTGDRLRETYEEMVRKLRNVRAQLKRTRGLDFKGLRGFEVTYNAERGELHPHFHIIVANRKMAATLIEEWVKRWDHIARSAQDMRPVGSGARAREELPNDLESDLVEVAKYITNIKGGYPPEVLDGIFRGMKGKQLVQAYGYCPSDYGGDTEEEIEAMEDLDVGVSAWKRRGEAVEWFYDPEIGDWVDPKTGELLTGRGYSARAGPDS